MPYKVVKTKSGYGVKNTDKGTFKSKNIPYERARRQFQLLEGIEHGTIKKGKKK